MHHYTNFLKNKLGQVLCTLLAISFLFFAASCGNSKQSIKVGSKEFTEQLLLGKITLAALENAGYTVVDKTGVAGSNKVRSALINKEIDICWEYTGTAWLSHLQHDTPITVSQECFEKVRDGDKANGITWLNYAPFNNTYTIMMRKEQAERLNIKTLSELGRYLTAHPKELKFAVDHEFTARADGLPGLEERYGFKMRSENVLVMDNAIVYKALQEGQVDIGMGFSTDGRIAAFGLLNLEDDKSFFPAYNPAPNLRTAFAEENPKIVAILNSISEKLDVDAICEMNYQVDIKQREPSEVAKEWLKKVGLIK